MPLCPSCHETLIKVHRTPLERVLHTHAFRCRTCGRRIRRFHRGLARKATFVFSTHTHCIRCGSSDVRRVPRRSRMESAPPGILNRLMRAIGAPLHSCVTCRQRYYDLRPTVSR